MLSCNELALDLQLFSQTVLLVHAASMCAEKAALWAFNGWDKLVGPLPAHLPSVFAVAFSYLYEVAPTNRRCLVVAIGWSGVVST